MLLSPEWLMQQGEDAMLLHSVNGAFSNYPDRIVVAVSGGGDSLALLDLALRVAVQTGQTVVAVTVNHGLRPEAEAEAAMVAAFCHQRAIYHETLHWDGTQATGNLMAAARNARYKLIADWAKGQGTGHVLLGHTADDVAETFLMQLSRGAGADGLAGMESRFKRHGLKWARPLWQVSRQELRDYLTRRDIAWVDDPTNTDPQYLRSRIRAAQPLLDDLGLTRDAIVQAAFAQRMSRKALEHYTQAEADRHLVIDQGDVLLPARLDIPEDIKRRLWRAILMWIGGGDYPPRQSAMYRLNESLMTGTAHTIHGCRVTVKKGVIRVTRELNAVAGLTAPTDALWDRRWQFTGPHDPTLHIAPLGPSGLNECKCWRDTGQPRDTLLASPAVWHNDRLIAAPLAGFDNGWRVNIVAGFTT